MPIRRSDSPSGPRMRKRQQEVTSRVGPCATDFEARGTQLRSHTFTSELRRNFGQDLLTKSEVDRHIEIRDLDALLASGAQSHLDASIVVVPFRNVFKCGEIEVRAELIVQDAEHVEIECSGNP